MNGPTQTWLVAVREMRERSRSRAFQVSSVLVLLLVVGVAVMPTLLGSGSGPRDVGLAGERPADLSVDITAQAEARGLTVRIRTYADRHEGEEAVRQREVDLLVIDGQHLVARRIDDELRSVVVGAIQMAAVGERATAAGITADQVTALLTPVPVDETTLGSVAGRSPDDELAAMIMTVVLFVAITTYGNLVLTGVVEEKASRVVEVLLARMPARNLLVGKVAGIGLLGLAQIGATALAALVAMAASSSLDLPATRGAVLAWAVVWFVLGYALYAMAYGALGSLTSRAEDAQAVSFPVVVVLMAGYFASFAALGRPESSFARAVSLFPLTAPLAMPNRIAMGGTSWWEPVVAALLTVATIAGLVPLGGRVYANAILHSGPRLSLRRVWRAPVAPVPAGRGGASR